MHKHIYLLRENREESFDIFYNRIINLSKSLSNDQNINKIKLTITSSPPPGISVIPFKKKKIAAISVYKTEDKLIEKLLKEPGFSGLYSVEEAIPVSYNKTWPDHEATPGVCLLTLFKQRKDIDRATFLNRWHNSHTPLSIKIHPLWNYNRNVVNKRLSDNSEIWDGIVEEHFRHRSDLLNIIKFFGHPFIMPYRMWQVYSDTKSFLDYKTIEPYLTTEVHIKS